MSKSLRRFALGIWTLLCVPLFVEFLKIWLGETYFSDPNTAVAVVVNFLASIGRQLWFQLALAVLTGLVIGVWSDRFARKCDADKSAQLRTRGYDFLDLASRLADLQDVDEWPQNTVRLRPQLQSAFLSASKLGVWAPDARVFNCPSAMLLYTYLTYVGRLLKDGHFDEAKKTAFGLKSELDKVVPLPAINH